MNRHLKIFFMCFSIVFLLVGCGEKEEEPVDVVGKVAEPTIIVDNAVSVDGVSIAYEVRGEGEPALVFIHDLRHTFGTRLIESGVDPVRVKKLMGHSTLLVTQRYLHTTDDGLRNAVAQLDTQLSTEEFGPQDWSTETEQLKELLYVQ